MRPNLASWVGIGVFVIAATLGSTECDAQQKFTFTHANPPDSSKYTKDFAIEVDDIPGHKVRVVEIQRTFTKDHPVIMGTKVLETWFRGFTDYGANGGPGHGYETWILEDGNRLYLESSFLSSTETSATGSRRGTSHSAIRFMGGTGKFVAIRGAISSHVEFDSDPKSGYNRPLMRGEYWLTGQ